ncbi:hypothetical protein B0H34DRAFT_802440 [Crassisporium funariophilum]|nr:hypothetical protein B0H34DRAFT_802440 [Crassisporium funariophilum]
MEDNTRTETYKDITIRKNNIGAQPQEDVDNEFRLIRLAIDNGWFHGRNAIKIIGTTHTTTRNGSQRTQSHLTLSTGPGGKPCHLYLFPVGAEVATEDTTLDEVVW